MTTGASVMSDVSMQLQDITARLDKILGATQ
jgi:hypothetical protein